MSYKKPVAIYGGPYAHETDEITLESSKEKPNYDRLISDWKSISQGALDYIESLKQPLEDPIGKFVNNVEIDYSQVDNTIPETRDFDRDKVAGKPAAVEDAPEPQTDPNQSEIDLDKL